MLDILIAYRNTEGEHTCGKGDQLKGPALLSEPPSLWRSAHYPPRFNAKLRMSVSEGPSSALAEAKQRTKQMPIFARFEKNCGLIGRLKWIECEFFACFKRNLYSGKVTATNGRLGGQASR